MPLPLNPEVRQLALSDIAAEFGGDPPHRMSEYFAGGPYVPANTTGTYGEVSTSGPLRLQFFYGTPQGPSTFTRTISTNLANLNIRSYMVDQGWDENQAVILIIDPNVYVYSTSTGVPAITTGSPFSTFPNGLTIVNNGFIIGCGGNGYRTASSTTAGQAGGNAINLGINVTIENNGYIAGGGGGGGGAVFGGTGGGGAGGGAGGGGTTTSTGTPGGTPGNVGSNGTATSPHFNSAGGGGRILPGTGGAGAPTSPAPIDNSLGFGGGAGGGGGSAVVLGRSAGQYNGGQGGGGGGWGASGGNGSYISNVAINTSRGGNGGGGNNAGETVSGTTAGQALGGAGGKAVNLNGFVVTWINTGTRYGAIT